VEAPLSHHHLVCRVTGWFAMTIIDLIKEHPGCKVTILEIPVYSIVSWTKHSGHKNPEKFTEQLMYIGQCILDCSSVASVARKNLC
jgi:hypothetical protein